MGNSIASATMDKRRIIGFDFIKTVAILLVITIHMLGGSTLPHTWYTHIVSTLTMVCVPLFVMVNGALMLTRPFNGEKHKRRIIQLILLTVIWKIIILAFCYFTLRCEADLSKSSILAYLLGGNPPYGDIGYIWFLNFYIGLMVLYPALKAIFDNGGAPLRYLLAFMLIVAIGDGLNILFAPISHMLGLDYETTAFGYFYSFNMLSWSGVLIATFLIGGIIWKWHLDGEKAFVSDDKNPIGRIATVITEKPKAASLITAAICFAVLYALVEYKIKFIDPCAWDITQRYSNIFNVCLSAAIFYLLSTANYPKAIGKFSIFMGSRTFSIYIMHIVAMNGIKKLMSLGAIPTGAGFPGAIDLLYLLSIYLISEFLLAVLACLIEKIPYAKALLFK